MKIKEIKGVGFIVEIPEYSRYNSVFVEDWVRTLDPDSICNHILGDCLFFIASEVITLNQMKRLAEFLPKLLIAHEITLQQKKEENRIKANKIIKLFKKVPVDPTYKDLSKFINNEIDEAKQYYDQQDYDHVVTYCWEDVKYLKSIFNLLKKNCFAEAYSLILNNNIFVYVEDFPLPSKIMNKLEKSYNKKYGGSASHDV